MNIINVKNNPPMKNVHNVKASKIYDSEHAVAVHITLEAGEQLIPHVTPVDVFFYVLEGDPTFEVGKERKTAAADHLIESPANIPHCIYNEKDKTARILVVKIPRPVTATKLL